MILVVDDNVVMAETICVLLRSRGWDGQCAFNGAAALAWLSVARAQCIILDDKMPGLSGLDVLQRIRQVRGLEVPVIMVSSAAEPSRQMTAEELGVVGWVKKTDSDGLLELVAEVCEAGGCEPFVR